MNVGRRVDHLERRQWSHRQRPASSIDLSVFTDDELEVLATFAERMKAAGPGADPDVLLTPDERHQLAELSAARENRLARGLA